MPGPTPISTPPSSVSLLVLAEWEKSFKNKNKKHYVCHPKGITWFGMEHEKNPHSVTLAVMAAMSVASKQRKPVTQITWGCGTGSGMQNTRLEISLIGRFKEMR